ncbi:MAG: hypothetical protein K6E29_06980 [Cyanobacteria bacterium RUI128]|nr:hypothetical protein [Cyanobacteria bacterium RUI128]
MEIKSIVGSKLGSLTFNRSTSTNPFEKTSFKGRTFKGSVLPFADVFQSIKPVETVKPNKVKMVAGAVISAVADFKTRLTQPIVDFVNSVKEGYGHVKEKIAGGVDSIKNAKNSLVEMGKSVKDRVAHVFEEKVGEPGPDGATILNLKHINEQASLRDLRATWVAENEKIVSKEGKAAA